MAHVTEDKILRERLTAHRDRFQHLIDQIDRGTDCARLLTDVVATHRALGALCSELAVEHLRSVRAVFGVLHLGDVFAQVLDRKLGAQGA